MTEQHAKTFGCDPATIMPQLVSPIANNGLGKVLNSMLSDAQEMMGCGQVELARKALNRIKFVIDNQFPRVRATPADVAVHEDMGALRVLHAQTTVGAWHALPGRSRAICGTVSPTGYEGVDVLRGQGRLPAEGKRNVDFCARMHNAAPAFFDAADLVQHVLTEQGNLPPEQRDAYIVDKAQATLSTLKQSLE